MATSVRMTGNGEALVRSAEKHCIPVVTLPRREGGTCTPPRR